MNVEDTIVGHYAFAPVRQKVLFLEKETSFSGNTFTLHKDEIDITWIRESSAFMELSWKGQSIKRLNTHNDFYGYLTSAESLIEDAPKVAKNFEILPTSELELHVVAYFIDTPTIGFATEKYNRQHYLPASRNGDSFWYDVDSVKDGASFNFKEFPMDDRRGVKPVEHSPTIVWNSYWNEATRDQAFKNFEALAKASEQTIGETDYCFYN